MEYDPRPPTDVGSVDRASNEVIMMAMEVLAPVAEQTMEVLASRFAE
jgi:hypothetical protein